MTATITVCDSCAFPDGEKVRNGVTGGAQFAAHVEHAAAGEPALRVRRFSCLMGCQRACNAALSAPGRVTYVLGSFEPGAEAAQALVDYARLYAASETGVVPYRSWPAGVKGHFVSRVPPTE